MKMTEEGLALIRRFEGFRERAYLCPAGVWTIGYGHTSRAGPPAVGPQSRMSRAEATKVLAADVEVFAQGVREGLRRNITDAQFSALVSFAYNVGTGAFRSSSVLRAVNAGDFDAVPRRLGLWVKGGGRVLPGLVKRRAAEAELFLNSGTAARPGEERWPEPVAPKRPTRSTTIISALIAAVAALLSGGSGVANGPGIMALALSAAGFIAALWIIRERMKKLKEDGI